MRLKCANYVFGSFLSLFMMTGCGDGSSNNKSNISSTDDKEKVAVYFTRADMGERTPINKLENKSMLMSSKNISKIIKEDASTGSGQWIVYDDQPAGAMIGHAYDRGKGSEVITLQGDGLNNGYVLGYWASPGPWSEKEHKVIHWNMNYSEDFMIYVRLSTKEGYRYLYYTPSDYNYGMVGYDAPHYIHHGLGSDATGGIWRAFSRDLEQDLKDFDPDNELVSVDGFFVRGSGMIDDVVLLKKGVELGMSEALGKALFFDKNLSKTRKTNCATCHDPKYAYIDPRYHTETNQTLFVNGAFSVGDDGISLGGRNSPTAAYAMFSPEFGEVDGIYKGGQFHDGRAATLKVQAMGPPLDGAEMQMPNKAAVVERIKENPTYVKAFKMYYGNDVFSSADKAYDKMAEAIADYERTAEFAPFDSKFDRWVDGEYTFNTLEQKGYDLYNSDKTNCRLCHTLNGSSISTKRDKNSREMFTNYEYDNIGTPRNIEAMNRRAALGLQPVDAKFRGLGSVADNSEHDGKSRVPTLRNIAVTDPYMSNGQFQKLKTVIEYYDFISGKGTHNINKESGKAWGENDFPATIDYNELSKTNSLSDDDINALTAFLRTLTDKKYEHLMRPFNP